MEFLFGSFVTILSIVVAKIYLNKTNKLSPLAVPKVSQSQKHQLLSPLIQIGSIFVEQSIDTQATRYHDAHSVKVLFTEDKAYWIANNAVYMAEVSDEGVVEEDSTQRVDTMGMSKVELKEISFIVDKLTEGKRNDTWGSGNS